MILNLKLNTDLCLAEEQQQQWSDQLAQPVLCSKYWLLFGKVNKELGFNFQYSDFKK